MMRSLSQGLAFAGPKTPEFSMIKPKILLLGAALATALGGCVVVPARHGGYVAAGGAYDDDGAYAAPAGVVYVAPTYAVPGPGFAWRYHPKFGWGWRHPKFGWHRGWK
jgi:hypothetical protein